jgi:acyl-ACP thioesterase
MEPIWREQFRVRFYDADPHGCVTLPALCRFLQVAADGHARTADLSMGALQAAGRMWVLTELSLSVQSFPLLDRQLTVETWGSSRMGGARAYRDFLVFDDKGQQVGCACTLWLYLDAATRRPLRLPEEILAFRVKGRDPVLPPDLPSMAENRESTAETSIRVGWQDLDQNDHANNVRYLEWSLQTVPDPIWRIYRPSAVSLRFQSEARLGDLLSSALEIAGSPPGLRMRHQLRKPGRECIASADTLWLPAHAASV